MDMYEQASKGLRFLFWSAIVGLLIIIPILGVLAGLVSIVLNIYALYTLFKVGAGYKTAFYAAMVNLLVTVIGSFAGEGALAVVFSIAVSILNFLTIYYICSTTGQLLEDRDAVLASRSKTIWILFAVCTAVLLLCQVMVYVPVVNIGAAVLAMIIAIVQLVANIMYLIFMWKSYKTLA